MLERSSAPPGGRLSLALVSPRVASGRHLLHEMALGRGTTPLFPDPGRPSRRSSKGVSDALREDDLLSKLLGE